MMCDQSTSVVMPALMHSSAPQRLRGVDVVGPVVRRELVEDRPEVGDQREVRRARPDRRLPGVAVGVDEARDDDVAGRVDDLRAVGATGSGRPPRSCRPRSGCRARQLAERRVLGEDDAALDERSFGHRSFPRLRFVGRGARVAWRRPADAVGRRSPSSSDRSWPASSAGDSRPSRSRRRRRPSARRPSDRARGSTAAWGIAVPDGVGELARSGAGPWRRGRARTRPASRPGSTKAARL